MPLFRVRRTLGLGKKFRRGDEVNFPMGTIKHLAEGVTGNENDWPTYFEVIDRFAKPEYGYKKRGSRGRVG